MKKTESKLFVNTIYLKPVHIRILPVTTNCNNIFFYFGLRSDPDPFISAEPDPINKIFGSSPLILSVICFSIFKIRYFAN